MRIKIFIFLLFGGLVFCSQTLTAQVFGGNPYSMKWKQINTDSFRIIFPQGLDSTAFNVAALVQFQQRNIAQTIGDKQRKINIVLQNQMTYSNGYVALAPFRSEFYLMPPMDVTQLGAQNWADNLAVHEYRHVEQYNNFDIGLSHVFKIIFGENGQAFANAIAVPDWFFEGDAVYNETLLSEQGRGRVPFFMDAFKALYLDNKKYNYQQIRNGSYINYIPDHYNLGYLLVNYGYQKYGINFWKSVTQDAATFQGLFYPMQRAIKKYSGLSFQNFRDSAFSYYQQQWAAEPRDTLHYFTKTEKKNVVDYQFPYSDENGNIIVLKSSYKRIAEFVQIKNGIEKSIAVRPVAYDDYFSYNNGKIIYAKLKPNVRWGYKEYSDIEMLDVRTKQKTDITRNKRYFTPDISHDGKMIAAVEYTSSQHSSIVLLDLKGNIFKHIAAQENHIYSYPKFSKDDNFIFVLERNKAGAMAIQQIDIASGAQKNILPFGNRLLGFPVVQGDTLFFTCSNNGADEGWAYISSDNKMYRLAKTQLGIYQSFVQNDSLIASLFTAEGYRLAKLKPVFQPIENLQADTLIRLYQQTPKRDYSCVLANVDATNYPITRYPKLYHPINFHSLQPYVDDPDYSLTLYGENVLNTLQTNISYTYNRVEQSHQIGAGSVFGGSFVEPYINASYIFDRTAYDAQALQNVRFGDAGWQFGVQLPLNFSANNFYRYFTYSASFNQRFINWYKNNEQLPNRSADYLSNEISFTNQCQQALQQLYPHFAQSLTALFRNTVDDNKSWQILAAGNFYFPGILSTHSVSVGLAWQRQDTLNNYSFSYAFPFSRGYQLYGFPEMWTYNLNYAFPIICPDAGFGDLVYLKRISANIFYDHSFGKNPNTATQHFASTGVEIAFDLNVWNQQPTGFTVRYSRLLNNSIQGSHNHWEIILPINLF